MLKPYHVLLFTDFGADSSSRFPFRALTNRQKDVTERSTHADGYTVGVGKGQASS